MTKPLAVLTFAEMSIDSGLCPLAVGVIPAAPPGHKARLKLDTK